MSFLDDIGNFLRQRIANPVGADLSHLGTAVHNITGDIGNTIQHPANFVQNQFPAFMQSHVPGFEAASEALYGKPGKINPTQGPGQVAMNWKGGSLNNLNPTVEDVLQQGAQGAYHVNPISFFDKNLSNTLGVNTNQNARTKAGQVSNAAGMFAGSVPTFLGGYGEADAGLNALKEIPTVGNVVEKAPLLSRIGQGVIANMAGGAASTAATPANNPSTYAKNIGIQSLSSAPFGIGGEFASPLLRAGQAGIQGLTSVGIMDLLSGGKINPQDLIQAGVPATLALIGGKGNDEAALKAYLDQHPEVMDKLQNHPAVEAMTTLAKDNRGSVNPDAVLQSTKDALDKVYVGKKNGQRVNLGDTLSANGEPPKGPQGPENPGMNEGESPNYPFGFDHNLHKVTKTDTPEMVLQKYVANRDTIRNSGRVLADAVKAQAPDANDRIATYFTNEIKNLGSPEEVQQFLNGTHPEFQKAMDEMTSIFEGKSPEEAKAAVKQYVDEINKYYKDAITKGQNPTASMSSALSLARQGLDYYLSKGREVGLFGPDVGKSDYLTHIIDTVNNDMGSTKNFGSDLNPGFQFAKQRIRPTIFHNLAHGEIPKHLDIANVVNEYTHKIASPLAMRSLINDMQKEGMGTWSSTPVEGLKQLGDITRKSVSFAPDSNGINTKTVQDEHFYVRPEVATKMNATFSKGLKPFFDQHSKLNALKTYQRTIKTADFWGSIFHLPQMLSAGEASMVNPLKVIDGIKTQLDNPQYQELIKLGTKYGVTGSQASDYREVLYKNTPDLREDQAYKNMASQIWGKSGGQMLNAAKKVGQFTNKIIFENVQTPLKYYDFNDKFNRWVEKHPNATQAQVDKAGFDIGKAINAFYGGNNKEALGISKTVDDATRLIFLAPDWNLSKLKSVQLAFNGGAGANAARRYIAMQVGLYVGASMLLNSVFGKDNKGNNVTVSPPVGGLASDLGHMLAYAQNYGLIGGAAREILNKTNGFVTLIPDLSKNTTYSGTAIYSKTDDPITKTLKGLGYAATQGNVTPIPFTFQNVASEIANNNNPKAKFQYSPGEIAYSAIMGQPPIHSAPKGLTANPSSNGDNPLQQLWGTITAPFSNASNNQIQFKDTTKGTLGGQQAAAQSADNNKDYRNYIKGIASGAGISDGILAGYMNYNGGFNGGSKNVQQTAQKLVTAYNKAGNWPDALKSLGAQNINGIMTYKIPTGTALNSSVNQYYTNTLYNPDYVNTAISGLAGIKPDQFGSLVQQFIVPDSSNPSKVNVSATEAKLKQYADSGAIGDWGPIMDQKINTSMGQYAAQNGFKFNDQTSGMDLIKKQIRAETSYDPANAGMIDQIISHDIGAYEQYGNWQDAITSLRFDPSTNQGKAYFNEIASSSSVSTSTDKQNWLTLQLQRSDTTAYVPTAQRMGLSPLNTSSNKQGSSQGVDQQVVTANAQPQTQKSQFNNISSSVPYADLINTAATKYGVPASIIAAVIQQESGFNPNAVGDNGTSFGLRQYNMPSHPNLTPAQAEDPAFAIDTLARDIGSNIGAAGGNWALAATNAQNPADHASYYNDINSLMGQFGGGTFAGNASGGSGGVDLASMLNGGMSLGDALNAMNTTATTGLGGITNKQLASDTNKYFAAQTKLEKPNMFKLKGTTKATGLQANSGLASGVNTKQAKFAKIKLPSGKTIAVKGGLAKLSTSELKKVLAQAKKDLNTPHYKIYLRTNPLKLSEQTVRQ